MSRNSRFLLPSKSPFASDDQINFFNIMKTQFYYLKPVELFSGEKVWNKESSSTLPKDAVEISKKDWYGFGLEFLAENLIKKYQ